MAFLRAVLSSFRSGLIRCDSYQTVFHDPDLLLCQSVEVIDQAVNLSVCGAGTRCSSQCNGWMALEAGSVVRVLGGGQPLVQVQHALDQRDHLVVLVEEKGAGGLIAPELSRKDSRPLDLFVSPTLDEVQRFYAAY